MYGYMSTPEGYQMLPQPGYYSDIDGTKFPPHYHGYPWGSPSLRHGCGVDSSEDEHTMKAKEFDELPLPSLERRRLSKVQAEKENQALTSSEGVASGAMHPMMLSPMHVMDPAAPQYFSPEMLQQAGMNMNMSPMSPNVPHMIWTPQTMHMPSNWPHPSFRGYYVTPIPHTPHQSMNPNLTYGYQPETMGEPRNASGTVSAATTATAQRGPVRSIRRMTPATNTDPGRFDVVKPSAATTTCPGTVSEVTKPKKPGKKTVGLTSRKLTGLKTQKKNMEQKVAKRKEIMLLKISRQSTIRDIKKKLPFRVRNVSLPMDESSEAFKAFTLAKECEGYTFNGRVPNRRFCFLDVKIKDYERLVAWLSSAEAKDAFGDELETRTIDSPQQKQILIDLALREGL